MKPLLKVTSHLTLNIIVPKSIAWVLNYPHLRFSSGSCSNLLISWETFKWDFIAYARCTGIQLTYADFCRALVYER
jgi:hypothetical protein